MTLWESTLNHLKNNVKGFELKIKEESKGQRLIAKLTFWNDYMKMWTTLYPKVYKPKLAKEKVDVLQHEMVHLLDAETLFGKSSKKLKYLNVFLFSFLYACPQILVAFSLLAFINPLWLLCLVFALPLPAPFRALAEARAYKRSIELGGNEELVIRNFKNSKYYWMLPSTKLIKKMLSKPSPYKELMDSFK